MKTFLVFKKEGEGYGEKVLTYQSEEVRDSSDTISHLHSKDFCGHFELLEGLDPDVCKPVFVEEELVEAVGELGDEDYVPEHTIAAHWELQEDAALIAAKVAKGKADQVTALYNTMNADVYGQMAVVFGTTNADSATAYQQTWALMLEDAAGWAGLGLKTELGVDIDTAQKVTDYASAKMAAVIEYGKWRMQRIQQFYAARAAILSP